MRTLALLFALAITPNAALALDGSYRPCEHFTWAEALLAKLDLTIPVAYCGAAALGDPDHTFVEGHPAPKHEESPPHQCPYDK